MILFFDYNGCYIQDKKNVNYTLSHIHKNERKKNVTYHSENCYYGSFTSTHSFLNNIYWLEGYFNTTNYSNPLDSNEDSIPENKPIYSITLSANYSPGQDIDFFFFFLIKI